MQNRLQRPDGENVSGTFEKTRIPPLPITGGCQCGAVRYRITGKPVTFYLCHCSECQRHTSSAFGESLRLKRGDLEIEGEVKLTTRVSEAGTLREGWFCPDCGVRIWHGSKGSALVNIKAGTLDDTSWLVPAGHIWVRSKQRFFALPADAICYDMQPAAGDTALEDRWQAMTTDS